MTTPAPHVVRFVEPEPPRRNCWSCRWGRGGRHCDALTLDEDDDRPILDWLDAAPMADDGTVPVTADGCPGWSP